MRTTISRSSGRQREEEAVTYEDAEDEEDEKIVISEDEVIVEDAGAEEDAARDDAAREKRVVYTFNYGPAVLPFLLPPMLMAAPLLHMGFLMRAGKKLGFFGPWW